MTHTYDPTRDIQELAADAILHAMALYKAAGYSREAFENMPLNFWASTKAAVPAETPAPAESARGNVAAASLEQAAIIADGIGKAYGEDETGWFECSETIAAAIRRASGIVAPSSDMNGAYKAKGRRVLRSPQQTATGMKMGFGVCEVMDHMHESDAAEIAEALNMHRAAFPDQH